jgi:hypothetical protein
MANDNPDWAKLEVGRIDTIRGASLSAVPSSSTNFDASFVAPYLYAINGDLTSFNCSVAGNTIGIVGSPSGTYVKIVDYVTPAATNLLYIYPFTITWGQAINLLALLPGDTSYQLQVRSGATGSNVAMSVTLYAGTTV